MAEPTEPHSSETETDTDTEGEAQPRLAVFESSLAELEALVEALETGDITLEQSLTKFERGVTLARQCQSLLKTAELRVDQLLADNDDERITEFTPENERREPQD